MAVDKISGARYRWRFRVGLPFSFLFGHTTIELESCENGYVLRESYGFMGWRQGVLSNLWLFWLIVFGVSCKGQWYKNAKNPLGVARRWHTISKMESSIPIQISICLLFSLMLIMIRMLSALDSCSLLMRSVLMKTAT